MIALSNEEKAATVARLRSTAESIRGPGMGTSIRSDELDCLIEALDDALAEVARLLRQSGRAPAKAKSTKAAKADEVPLGELIPALADILESHAELWGQSPVSALEAWCAQQQVPMPDTWVAALDKALAGGR